MVWTVSWEMFVMLVIKSSRYLQACSRCVVLMMICTSWKIQSMSGEMQVTCTQNHLVFYFYFYYFFFIWFFKMDSYFQQLCHFCTIIALQDTRDYLISKACCKYYECHHLKKNNQESANWFKITLKSTFPNFIHLPS